MPLKRLPLERPRKRPPEDFVLPGFRVDSRFSASLSNWTGIDLQGSEYDGVVSKKSVAARVGGCEREMPIGHGR